MKIQKQTSSKKWIYVTLACTFILAAAVGVYFYHKNESGNSKTNTSPATTEEKADGDAAKKKTVESSDSTSNSGSAKTTPDTNSQGSAATPSSPSSTVPVRISAKSQNGNVYQIRTLVEGVVSNGTCTLTATKAQQTVTRTAGIQALAQSSTCQGFDIPTSELTPGTWSVQITFSGDGASGSTTDSVEVK